MLSSLFKNTICFGAESADEYLGKLPYSFLKKFGIELKRNFLQIFHLSIKIKITFSFSVMSLDVEVKGLCPYKTYEININN